MCYQTSPHTSHEEGGARIRKKSPINIAIFAPLSSNYAGSAPVPLQLCMQTGNIFMIYELAPHIYKMTKLWRESTWSGFRIETNLWSVASWEGNKKIWTDQRTIDKNKSHIQAKHNEIEHMSLPSLNLDGRPV